MPAWARPRLLDAVVATAEGATVLRGRGHALGAGIAYGPVAGALARHLHGLAPEDRDRLVGGLTSLGLLLEGIGEPVPPGDHELDRARMFQAVGLLLSRMAATSPVVLCIDDLHWADTASVELLVHLVAELGTEAVAFAVAARPGELAARPDTRHLVAQLLRLPGSSRLLVGPLDDDAVAAVVADRLGAPAAPAFVAEIVEVTGGVVLAVDAVLRALADDGAVVEKDGAWVATRPVTIPGYVVDLFHQRLDALDPATRAVVGAVAVADAGLDTTEVAVLVGIDAAAAADAASAGRHAGFLVEIAPGTWETSHPLVGTAARDGMADGERRALHGALADLPRLQTDGALDDLARHVVAAGTTIADDRATDVLARAGRRALARGAGDVAARWLAAAADRAEAAGRPVAEVARLHGQAGDAWERAGALDQALSTRARQADLLDGTDAGGAAGAAAAAAGLCWQLGRPDGDTWWTRALDLADRAGPDDRLRIHHRRLGGFMRQGRFDEATVAAELVRRDLAGDAHGPDAALARLRLLVFECLGLGQPVEALLEHDVALPADAPPAMVAEVEGVRLDALVLLGRFDDARRRADELLAGLGVDAAVTGLSWRPITARLIAYVAAGAWDDAADLLTELSGDTAVARSSRAVWSGLLAVRRGDVDAARQAIAEGRKDLDVEGMAMRHRAIDVVAAYADVVAGERPSVDVALDPHVYFAMSHGVLAALAGEVLVASGRPADARIVAAGLRSRGRPGTFPHAVADRLDALATGDAAALVAAAAAARRLRRALRRRRRPPRGRRARSAGRAAVDAGPVRGDLRPARARRHGRRGPVPSARPHRGEPTRWFPSSPLAEREVAELVAEGLTNGQVAERLGVSIRTVTSHLDHAYTKLGIGSRAALVAHLLRLPTAT